MITDTVIQNLNEEKTKQKDRPSDVYPTAMSSHVKVNDIFGHLSKRVQWKIDEVMTMITYIEIIGSFFAALQSQKLNFKMMMPNPNKESPDQSL